MAAPSANLISALMHLKSVEDRLPQVGETMSLGVRQGMIDYTSLVRANVQREIDLQQAQSQSKGTGQVPFPMEVLPSPFQQGVPPQQQMQNPSQPAPTGPRLPEPPQMPSSLSAYLATREAPPQPGFFAWADPNVNPYHMQPQPMPTGQLPPHPQEQVYHEESQAHPPGDKGKGKNKNNGGGNTNGQSKNQRWQNETWRRGPY